MASSSKLPSPVAAQLFSAANALSTWLLWQWKTVKLHVVTLLFTFSWSLVANKCSSLAICDLIVLELSMDSTSTCSSFSRRYLLTPTIVSNYVKETLYEWVSPRDTYIPASESILACFFAAASSILNLGIPEATAFAIPPISSIWSHMNTIIYQHGLI